MDKNRYLDLDARGSGLVEAETDAGWHFCPDWDGMLIGPGWRELDACLCGTPNRETEGSL